MTVSDTFKSCKRCGNPFVGDGKTCLRCEIRPLNTMPNRAKTKAQEIIVEMPFYQDALAKKQFDEKFKPERNYTTFWLIIIGLALVFGTMGYFNL